MVMGFHLHFTLPVCKPSKGCRNSNYHSHGKYYTIRGYGTSGRSGKPQFNHRRSHILKNVSFKVNKGEVFTILGGSGSGKTTITKCIVGLLKPTSGSIKVFGKDITQINPLELNESKERGRLCFSRCSPF
jgi:ABC-type oligopeptide transport system ATPase subunit